MTLLIIVLKCNIYFLNGFLARPLENGLSLRESVAGSGAAAAAASGAGADALANGFLLAHAGDLVVLRDAGGLVLRGADDLAAPYPDSISLRSRLLLSSAFLAKGFLIFLKLDPKFLKSEPILPNAFFIVSPAAFIRPPTEAASTTSWFFIIHLRQQRRASSYPDAGNTRQQ